MRGRYYLKKVFKFVLFSSAILLTLFTVIFFSLGCSVIYPKKQLLSERLADLNFRNLPLKNPVNIYWNEYAVPYVEAENDEDLAFTLGLLHAHLRSAQLALFKRAAQGRLSEMAGPLANGIDYLLRIIDFGKAAEDIEKNLPPETKAWVGSFVQGLNFYQDNTKVRPPEFALLGLEYEPWTVRDVLTLTRLAGTDVTWLMYFSLLNARAEGAGFSEDWQRLLEIQETDMTSFEKGQASGLEFLSNFLSENSRSGSNSIAISAAKSSNGAAILHNDPHLGFNLPNIWILAGVHSPNINAVGMMIPGIPMFGIGRNQNISWGGTNMRAASSDLVILDSDAEFQVKKTKIKTRLWPDAEREIRVSQFGPVISDSGLIAAKAGENLALKWIGHEASDEVSAFLNAAKAKNIPEFISAFRTFAVSAQNILFADDSGNIGHILAAWLPEREPFSTEDLAIDSEEARKTWAKLLTSGDLPSIINPPQGFLASANNKPVTTMRPIAFAFSDDERISRIKSLLSEQEKISLEDLKAVPLDVFSQRSFDLKEQLSALMPEIMYSSYAQYLNVLKEWNGFYEVESKGALYFEIMLYFLIDEFFKEYDRERKDWRYISRYWTSDLESLTQDRKIELFSKALRKAQSRAAAYRNWGDFHRLRVGGVLSNIPLLGSLFRLQSIPAAGSRETLMKTAHSFAGKRHFARYGSQSRHISDMSDPDKNYFVLFGGQDGIAGSVNYADQVELWKKAEHIQIPLRLATIKEQFKRISTLKP